jgi:uncharacterized protein YjeT (DUF2065 family)
MVIMWNDLFAAIALLLVFEGIMPFVNPVRWRQAIRLIAEQPDSTLRIMGLTSMLSGAALLYVIR